MTEMMMLSSGEQIILPKAIQAGLSWQEGVRCMVYSDGENVLIKPAHSSGGPEFGELMKQAQVLAAESGLTEEDIKESIRTVRQRRKQCG